MKLISVDFLIGSTTRLLVLDLSLADLTLNLDSEVQIDGLEYVEPKSNIL